MQEHSEVRTVPVITDTDDTAPRARVTELARRYGLPVASDPATIAAEDPAVVLTARGAEFRERSGEARSAIRIDFSSLVAGTGPPPARRQPLARAFGRSVRTVVDATAGTGQDACLLACFGYDVTAVERSAVLALLLDDGIERARQDDRLHRAIGDRLQVVHADARSYLPTLAPVPDAVFVDPMFPPRRKTSALPPKHVQVLRRLVGEDEDAGELLAIARRCARKRVVVKRPTHAPPLAPSPDAVHEGKLVRYDVYVTPGGGRSSG